MRPRPWRTRPPRPDPGGPPPGGVVGRRRRDRRPGRSHLIGPRLRARPRPSPDSCRPTPRPTWATLSVTSSAAVPVGFRRDPQPRPSRPSALIRARRPGGRSRRADNPLDDARDALQHSDYSGQMTIGWTDSGGPSSGPRGGAGDPGLVTIDGPTKEVADGGERMILRANGWTLMWPAASLNAAPPALQRKYAVATSAGPVVAGRPTKLIEVDVGGVARDRLAVDTDTGVLLRREQFDSTGQPVRVMAFETPSGSRARDRRPRNRNDATSHSRCAPDGCPHPSSPHAPWPAATGASGCSARPVPSECSTATASTPCRCFQQAAGLDASRLRSGGRVAMVGRSAGRAYAWPGGEVVTWARSSTTYTLVGDGPADDVVAAASRCPAPGRCPRDSGCGAAAAPWWRPQRSWCDDLVVGRRARRPRSGGAGGRGGGARARRRRPTPRDRCGCGGVLRQGRLDRAADADLLGHLDADAVTWKEQGGAMSRQFPLRIQAVSI